MESYPEPLKTDMLLIGTRRSYLNSQPTCGVKLLSCVTIGPNFRFYI